ncbi:MAG: hypothetical protein IRY99_22900 [Isosphaeraceae bacterium]|nr:hypothetical protein [Isosphaeraceae bacterium]
MSLITRRWWIAAALLAWVALPASMARASLFMIDRSQFPSNSPLITFDNIPFGVEVNGLTVSGVNFQVTVGGVSSNGQVVIDDGPGITNNIVPPNIVSVTSAPLATVTLTVNLPIAATQFGYGYAILAPPSTVPNGTTIQLFSGSTSLGSLSYTATPDPFFPGGFAGIGSTIPFDRAELMFSPQALQFAVDNILFTPVPEPMTLTMTISGGVAALAIRWRRRRGAAN